MINISPRKMFMDDEQKASAFRNIAHSDTFQSAVAHALSEFALSNPSSDAMAGAQAFMQILVNLAELPDPIKEFPNKTLFYGNSSAPRKSEKK